MKIYSWKAIIQTFATSMMLGHFPHQMYNYAQEQISVSPSGEQYTEITGYRKGLAQLGLDSPEDRRKFYK